MIDALQKAVDAACAKMDEQRAELASLRAKLEIAEKALGAAAALFQKVSDDFRYSADDRADLAVDALLNGAVEAFAALAAIREGRE